jgi:hypothetical protein
MKKPTLNSLRFVSAGLSLSLALVAYNAQAQNQYFEPVSNGNTYSWDGANWTAPAAANAAPYTYNWSSGDFARFYNGASDNYIVTVNASEQNTGLYNDSSSSTLNINDAGNGTGNLYLDSGLDAFITASSAYTYINAPITGPGTLCPETSGNIYLTAANSYTGGTALGESGNALVNFNNDLAFSTVPITLHRTGIGNFSTLIGYGGQTLALANNFSLTSDVGTGTGLNFASAANTPVVSSGTWGLGTYNLNLRSSGGSTAPLTISGAISGSGILALSANGSGSQTILSAVNPFTGTIIVTGSGGTYGGNGAITLQLGAANAIASSSSINLAGGTLNGGGFTHANSGTLQLTASSTLDFGGGNMSFADSHALAWTGVLNLGDWVGTGSVYGGTQFEVGTSSAGLTAAQLADIEFDGNAGTLGEAGIDANGFVYMIPEPSTLVLSLLGGLGVLRFARRRTA